MPISIIILHIICCTYFIFIIGSIIDYFRRKVERFISKYLDNNETLNKINSAFNVEI